MKTCQNTASLDGDEWHPCQRIIRGKDVPLSLLCKDAPPLGGVLHYKPRIDKEILAQWSEGLIVLSGCLKGEIPYLIQSGSFEQAQKVAGEYRDMLGEGNFYLEIQDHGINDQKKVNEGLLKVYAQDCKIEPREKEIKTFISELREREIEQRMKRLFSD